MELDPDEEEIGDLVLDDERDRHYRMVFEYKNEGWMVQRPFYMLRSVMSKIQRTRLW